MKKINILISILIIWSVGPLIWQLYTSFSTEEAILKPLKVIDNRWTLQNYITLFTSDPPFWKYLLNSLLLGFLSTVLTLVLSVPASYYLSKIGSYFKGIAKTILISFALFPYVLVFLALLEIARKFNLGNNLLILSVPYAALSIPLAVLLLLTCLENLPNELEEAAILEGLNIWQRLRWILLPLILPITASTSILVFIFSWNEYPIALTWISQSNLITLPVAIARLAGSSVYSVPYGAYAAATVLGSIPLLLIVTLFQKQIVSGLTSGAIKG